MDTPTLESCFELLIEHLPADELKRIPAILDRLIDATNKLQTALNHRDELEKQMIALADPKEGDVVTEELRASAQKAVESNNHAHAAYAKVNAAALTLASLCPRIPANWKSNPNKEDNKIIAEELGMFRDYVKNKVRKAAAQCEPGAPSKRFIIDRETNTITLDGQLYDGLDPDAVAIVAAYYELKREGVNGPIPPSKLMCRVQGLNHPRTLKRRLDALPLAIQNCIKRKAGAGKWFELPPLKTDRKRRRCP